MKTKPKTIILSLLIFLVSQQILMSQVIKQRTEWVATQLLIDNEWQNLSKPTELNELVVLNLDKKRISVFTKETQEYDIIEVLTNEKYENGGSLFSFRCIDQNGEYSDISLFKEINENGLEKYLIVEKPDFKLYYKLTDI